MADITQYPNGGQQSTQPARAGQPVLVDELHRTQQLQPNMRTTAPASGLHEGIPNNNDTALKQMRGSHGWATDNVGTGFSGPAANLGVNFTTVSTRDGFFKSMADDASRVYPDYSSGFTSVGRAPSPTVQHDWSNVTQSARAQYVGQSEPGNPALGLQVPHDADQEGKLEFARRTGATHPAHATDPYGNSAVS